MLIPSAYKDGYTKAVKFDAEYAERYISHTNIGDPLADNLVADLEKSDSKSFNQLVQSAIRGSIDPFEVKDAPQSFYDFFAFYEKPPDWLDIDSFIHGNRMFHRNVRLILAGMVGGVLVEGFSTIIAKSFFITGRLRDSGVRRLKQNNRHMLEIFSPQGLDKYNDGWIYSVRIRLIHSKVRSLLTKSDEWNIDEFGTPISSANLGFAIASFSAQCIYHISRLGASFNDKERENYMDVWRYSGYLMGIPESILFTDENDAQRLRKVSLVCEPPPSLECIVMASALINSAPIVAGISKPDERKQLTNYVRDISRALIGNELADKLRYKNKAKFGTLWKFRLLTRVDGIFSWFKNYHVKNFDTIMSVSHYNEDITKFNLPSHVFSEESKDW